MLKKRNSIQMELNFAGSEQNIFRDRVENGVFQVLAEIHTPSADTKMEHAVQRYADFAYLTEAFRIPAAGLALVQTEDADAILDPVQFLGSLTEHNPSAHLLYLSGREHTADEILAEAKHALSAGIKNVCPVSGAVPAELTGKELSGTFFLESVNALHTLQERGEKDLYQGAVINPYKYTACDASIQYYKAMRKIAHGAQFLVAQYGWDMAKLQELRWQLWRRNQNIPLFARLICLDQPTAAKLCAGEIPGIHISPDMEAMLRSELHLSSTQFRAAQLARLPIHAAGAKLMGFSGVQIAGLETPEMFESVLNGIRNAIAAYPTFEAWHDAYSLTYDRISMTLYPQRFYFFENLLTQASLPDEFQLSDATVPLCTQKELLRKRLGEMLFAHASEISANERKLTKKLIFGCRSCEQCRVAQTFYICPEKCPKGMANGPCGETNADGTCPYKHTECDFSVRMRLANESGEYHKLENEYVEAISGRSQSN